MLHYQNDAKLPFPRSIGAGQEPVFLVTARSLKTCPNSSHKLVPPGMGCPKLPA